MVWDNGDGPLREVPLPSDLPPCHGDLSPHYYSWISPAEAERYPRTFNKWALEFRTIQTYPDESYLDSSGASQLPYRAIVRPLMREQFRLILPNPPIVPPSARNPGVPRPSVTFPECWIHVDIVTGRLMDALRREVDAKRPPPELRDEYLATLESAAGVANEARAKPPFEILTSARREEFYAWYESIVAPRREGVSDHRTLTYLSGHINAAYEIVAAMLASRGGELSNLLDDAAINAVRLRHLPYGIGRDGRSEFGGWHQMFGHGGNIQVAAQHFCKSHILLAQFASGAPFMWGDVGMLQYWIDADDLVARDFSRVHVTVESH